MSQTVRTVLRSTSFVPTVLRKSSTRAAFNFPFRQDRRWTATQRISIKACICFDNRRPCATKRWLTETYAAETPYVGDAWLITIIENHTSTNITQAVPLEREDSVGPSMAPSHEGLEVVRFELQLYVFGLSTFVLQLPGTNLHIVHVQHGGPFCGRTQTKAFWPILASCEAIVLHTIATTAIPLRIASHGYSD